MDIITVNKENLDNEHICCAISSNKDCQVASKKAWLLKRFDDGLVFKKGDVRGKCFIEYIPAEKAWCPIEAEEYMFINCFWVSGRYKGEGNSNLLLEECIKDSKEKGKKGLVVLSSKKKKPYLSDPEFLRYKGFKLADTLESYFELLYLPFDEDSIKPSFNDNVKRSTVENEGFVLYYSHQCPFTAKYVPIIEEVANSKGIKFKSVLFETYEEAQNSPCPFTTYALFYNGDFVTHEILNKNRFEKIVDKLVQQRSEGNVY